MLHVTCFGNKASPPILFLHGLLGSTEDFLPMIDVLKKDFYCIGVDLPGHGHSPLINPLTIESTLRSLLEVMRYHNFYNGIIVGYSLGGRLAMLLEYYHSHLFDKVIILSAHPGLNKEEKQKRLITEKKWIALLEKDQSVFLEAWYNQPLFKTLDLSSILKKRSTINKDAIIQTIQNLSLTKQRSLWNHLSKTSTPFLFLYGQHDEKYKELYKKLFLTLKQKMIPLASHAIHLENPVDCTRAIKEISSKKKG